MINHRIFPIFFDVETTCLAVKLLNDLCNHIHGFFFAFGNSDDLRTHEGCTFLNKRQCRQYFQKIRWIFR